VRVVALGDIWREVVMRGSEGRLMVGGGWGSGGEGKMR